MKEQIKELTLLLLYLTSWEEKDELISQNTYKSKSTYLTDSGTKQAKQLIEKYNIKVE